MTNIENIETRESNRNIIERKTGLLESSAVPGVRYLGLNQSDIDVLISTGFNAGSYTLARFGDQLQVSWTEHHRDDPNINMVSTFDALGRLVRHERTNRFPWVDTMTYDNLGRLVHACYFGGFENNFSESSFNYINGELSDNYTTSFSGLRKLRPGEWEELNQS